MVKKYFGTDGIRGRVGTHPIDPEFMLKLGWAVGKVFSEQGQSRVLIGKDTRISGYMFESALEAGLSAAGMDTLLLGPMPTPAVAYLARTFTESAGIVISASHNQFADNGIKFFSTYGTKLPDETELAIEAQIEKPMTMVSSDQIGKSRRIEDARGRYIEFCKSTISRSITLRDLVLVVDCANGATYKMAPDVFEELGAKVIPLNCKPDGLNINLDCGSTHVASLQKAVVDHKADLGIAFDGDGDRVIMVDHNGEEVDGDQLLYIISEGKYRRKKLTGGVVGTLMSNIGLELALDSLGIDFIRAKVGDRYVMEQLKSRNWLVGGESSGHLVCLDKTTTGDGIVSALQVLEAMVQQELSLADIKQGMQKMPQTMINVRLPQKMDVMENGRIKEAVADLEQTLAGKGRVLLRPSGTEPVIRVMVEGENAEQVNVHCEQLAGLVTEVVNQ